MNKRETEICIVGGGASGLVAAIYAARSNASVMIIEKNEQLGRKILSTGNGRCNFTNSDFSQGMDFYFHSSSGGQSFVNDKDYLTAIDFYKELGVSVRDISGYFYPFTNQAKTIQTALELEVKRLGIDVLCDTKVTSVNKLPTGSFLIRTNQWEILSKKVILATGGLAAPKLGSDGDGIRFAKKLGINVVNPYPALVGLNYGPCLEFNPSLLAGVRCQGLVTYKDTSFDGEIQFNKDGISGYPVMCLSHRIGSFKRDNSSATNIFINFLPELSYAEIVEEIRSRFLKYPDFSVKLALNGLIPDKVADCILDKVSKTIRIKTVDSCKNVSEEFIDKLASNINCFSVNIENTRGFNDAQTTGGGVDCRELKDNLECKKIDGLYMSGELLDVDGICGGYNLLFAFNTGRIAGQSSANSLKG